MAALQDAPEAFAATYEASAGKTEADWRASTQALYLVAAFDGARPVGLMALIRHGAARIRHRGEIVMVWVRPEARGQGAAEAMLAAIADHGSATGLSQLELSVNAESPRAVAFYQRAGFRPFGRVPSGLRVEDGFVDEILMVLPLDASLGGA